MGVIDLERVVWPSDTTISGADMDILARKALWEVGLDYKHGTGHGVGTLSLHCYYFVIKAIMALSKPTKMYF